MLAEATKNLRTLQSELVDIGAEDDARPHAMSIAKMVPYYLQPEMGVLGTYIIDFPANLALCYFGQTDDSVVRSWLTKVFVDTTKCELKPQPSHMLSLNLTNEPSNKASKISMSNPSDRKSSGVMVKFQFENPSRYYHDTSGDTNQNMELALRPNNTLSEK